MDDSKLIRLESETYRLAVEGAERRGFATLSELFKAYDAALLRSASGCEEPAVETQRRYGVKFRKKPVEIRAIQWTGDNADEIRRMAPGPEVEVDGDKLLICTLEGCMTASCGDWIIRGVKGELYPCKPDIFEATYEPVFGLVLGTQEKESC